MNSTNGFEKLAQMDLKNVSLETHISHDFLGKIINKDFSSFKDKNKIKGFITILEKYYDLNLQSLMDEYLEYYSVHFLEPEQPLQEIPPSKNYFIIIFFLIIGIVIGTALYFIATSSTVSNLFKKDDQSNSIDDISEKDITEELKKVLDKKNIKIPSREKTQNEPSLEEELENELSLENEDLNALDLNLTIDLNQSIIKISNNDLNIKSTLGRVWVGIVDLSTYERRSEIIDNNKTYPIYDDMIFITGHGHLKLSSYDANYTTKSGDKQYFYYKDNQFIKLKRIEYLYLNKGIEW